MSVDFFKVLNWVVEKGIPLVSAISSLVLVLSNLFQLKFDKSKDRDFDSFKKIKEEYAHDKNYGCSLFQHYLKMQVFENVIDYTLASPDSYTIMKNLKRADSFYLFDGQKFIMKNPKRLTIFYYLVFVFFMVLSFFLIFYILNFDLVLKDKSQNLFSMMFFFVSVILGMLVCFSYMCNFQATKELVKITAKNEEAICVSKQRKASFSLTRKASVRRKRKKR